jgi:uncharacterized surface protein with fasciclin (FAS1) repeats
MRKLLALLFVLVLFVVPAAAQDATIAEIVVAATEGEEPEFTYLLTAVAAADPAVLEALSDPEADLTVFAPTDAAFEALAEALGEEAFGAILADVDALTGILLYHVIDGAAYSEDVVALLEENMGEFEVETLLGEYLTVAGNVEDGITINDANLVLEMVDIEASNGVIHVIDAVLVPMGEEDMEDMDEMDMLPTIAELVVAATEGEEPEFVYLLTAVAAADPAVLEALSNPEAELTVFAPTDAAFEALAEALGEEAFNGVLADTELLTGILLYHVLGAEVYSEDVLALLEENMGEFTVETLNGQSITVAGNVEDGITIDGPNLILEMVDIEAANGVIHVIDAVILPATEE